MYQLIPGNPDNFPATIRTPGGADPRNATTIQAGLSDLADRTAHLYQIVSAIPPNDAEVVPLDLGSARAPAIGSSVESHWLRLWKGGANIGQNELWSSSGEAADPLMIEATPFIPKPCKITSFGVVLRGYADQTPIVYPKLALMRRPFFGGGFSGTGNGLWDQARSDVTLAPANLAQYTSSDGMTFEVDCDVDVRIVGEYCWAVRVTSDIVQSGHGQGCSVRVAWLRTQRL